MAQKKMRQESITLTQDPDDTWAGILPRTDLKQSHILIERASHKTGTKYLLADADKVRAWLQMLFKDHSGIVQLKKDGKLKLSEEALKQLNSKEELAQIDDTCEPTEQLTSYQARRDEQVDSDGLAQASMQPSMTKYHVFSFIKNITGLYLKLKDALKLKKDGRLQVINDKSVRSHAFHVSSTMAFPHLYYDPAQKAPSDIPNTRLAADMMRKQMLFGLETADGNLKWWTAEDSVHMMHGYANLQERLVNDKVGYVMHEHPETAHIPVHELIDTLKQGANDQGLIDSKLPNLNRAMCQIQNSREFWYSERLGVEAMSRDCGRPNVFSTYNTDCRNWFRTRQLLYELEKASNAAFIDDDFDAWYPTTEQWTQLVDKHATFLSDYLQRYFKTFFEAFYCDICGVPKSHECADYAAVDDRTSPELSWFWNRVEWTETRGLPHWHCLVKLPHVLDTSLLGKVSQEGRVVRQELLCGNIKREHIKDAWTIIEMGFLAERYALLFTNSVQSSSFYKRFMDMDEHDEREVINLTQLTETFVQNYQSGTINYATHPIMRTPLMHDKCCSTREMELATIAAVSQVHQCLPNSCGGDAQTGNGCRFDFPKRLCKKPVLGMLQINSEQMEARVVTKRTDARVNNVNPLAMYWWRANSDHTALIDAAHSMRYCTKYASKSSKHSEMYLQLLEHLRLRGLDNISNNVRHVLVQVFLGSCAYRTFVSKMEVAFKVMQLPLVMKSFRSVEVEGCYWRATLLQSTRDPTTVVYSDRTKYAAYAERLDKTTVVKSTSVRKLKNMCLREFCELVACRFVRKKSADKTDTQLTKNRRLKSCEKDSGHWVLTMRKKRGHVRFSTTLNTDLAIRFVPVDPPTEHSPQSFYEMPIDQRRQLTRSYYELVCYVPWSKHPDEIFLTIAVREDLNQNDAEKNCRYSMRRCERYYEVYRDLYRKGHVAPVASLWHHDNQMSYSTYLIGGHNSEVKLTRWANGGKYNALFEPAEELVGTDVDIRPALYDDADDYDYPSIDNYLLADHFTDIMNQPPPSLQEVAVAYSTHNSWQAMDSQIKQQRSKRFIANPPPPQITFDQLTAVQQLFVKLVIRGEHQVMYLLGKAGSGKSEVLKHICQQMGKGKVQIGAATGKAASYFNGPTVHGMFGLSHRDFSEASAHLQSTDRKCQDNRIEYEQVELFIIDEAGMLPTYMLGFLDEVMTKSFNPNQKKTLGQLLPFGGKRILFVGDMAQLPPVDGEALYVQPKAIKKGRSLRASRAATGYQLYRQHLRPNVTIFEHSHRNTGLLSQIANAVRNGNQTAIDLDMLETQYRRFAPIDVDHAMHYTNEAAMSNNWKSLWKECKRMEQRIYVARASYHETESNKLNVDVLSSLPSKAYNYVPHLLCLSIGCEVRLVKNVDVSAGLVNSAIGSVVEVLYDASDVKHVLAGKHPPPYAVVVNFESFSGFKSSPEPYPFPKHKHWVSLTRQKFTVLSSDVPVNVRRTQQVKDCWRLQFPIDLANHITVHRAQGATFANSRVLVDLGLDNPSGRIPADAGSMLYVAITRAMHLKNVFVAPIALSVWEKLGKSKEDEARRTEEAILHENARNFAAGHGQLDTIEEELSWVPNYAGNEEEWEDLKRSNDPPERVARKIPVYVDNDFEAVTQGGDHFLFRHRPVLTERHIGIDQGTKHFAVVAVDVKPDSRPTIVSAQLYTDLNLPRRFDATHVALALSHKKDLMMLMQIDGNVDDNSEHQITPVDRVIVHVEQMNVLNANARTFGTELATLLQRLAPDLNKCVVRLSHPNLLHAGGPAFCLGDKIVQELNLQPVSTLDVEFRNASKLAARSTYDKRKQMSSDIYQYIMEADAHKLDEMKVAVSERVRQCYFEHVTAQPTIRLHDLGDALLHALRGVLCGSSTFRSVIPKSLSLFNNRTVCISYYPKTAYWVSTLVSWDGFVVEGMGWFVWRTSTDNPKFLSNKFINSIVVSVSDLSNELGVALKNFDGNNVFSQVDSIKVVIKQQTLYHQQDLHTRQSAGALTNATVLAMHQICDEVMGKNSNAIKNNTKKSGSVYLRTSRLTGAKYQVTRSTGKHTNAVLCCLSWFRTHLTNFVSQRRLILKEWEKQHFFRTIRKLARDGRNRLELIQFSQQAQQFLASNNDGVLLAHHYRNFADLLLISLSKNQQHVKAVAASYRKSSARLSTTQPAAKRPKYV